MKNKRKKKNKKLDVGTLCLLLGFVSFGVIFYLGNVEINKGHTPQERTPCTHIGHTQDYIKEDKHRAKFNEVKQRLATFKAHMLKKVKERKDKLLGTSRS